MSENHEPSGDPTRAGAAQTDQSQGQEIVSTRSFFDPTKTSSAPTDQQNPSGQQSLETEDCFTGYICGTCELIWLGDYSPEDIGEDDDYDVETARRRLAGATMMYVHNEADSGLNEHCLICGCGVIITGHPTMIRFDPAQREAELAELDIEYAAETAEDPGSAETSS